ncbi:DUF763 domain-containing protein [bacterium]|nr:DUF763 domain-containing protein [bacterium]
MRTGIATVPLDTGRCPPWLFERMKKLSQAITIAIVEEFGPEEFLKRIADPVWFQSLGCVIGFDWNSSGLTTTTLGALKEGIRGIEKDIGIFICGGKGRTSRKTPDQIAQWGQFLGLNQDTVQKFIYASKISAKVDNTALQDGYQIYHHNFIFSRSGKWVVVQQGMNETTSQARRYHWFSDAIGKNSQEKFVEEPHSGIITQQKTKPLNLTAKESKNTRQIATELVSEEPKTFLKDIRLIQKHQTSLIKKQKVGQLTLMELNNIEFHWHPVLKERFDINRLKKIIASAHFLKPKSFEELLSIRGIGPKTIRALSLVTEIIYGAKPSYEDPARYSFAHGGKDGTPYFVDRETYDKTIEIIVKGIQKSKVSLREKQQAFQRLKSTFSL